MSRSFIKASQLRGLAAVLGVQLEEKHLEEAIKVLDMDNSGRVNKVPSSFDRLSYFVLSTTAVVHVQLVA